MNRDWDKKNTVCECKLDDGRVVVYDGCCTLGHEDFYNTEKWELIGRGVIWSIDGNAYKANQTEDKLFFRLKG
jgi:hypothetical protein